MTEKRFIGSSGGVYDQYKGDRFTWAEWEEIIQIMNNLNEKARERSKALSKLQKENEQLKKREETLLCEIEDFQELLTKNDGVCHKRVIDLIDDKIFNFSNMKAELLLSSDDDYRLEKLSFAIQNLRELKEELENDRKTIL